MKKQLVGVIAIVAVLSACTPVAGGASPGPVLSPHGRVLGKSYAEWVVASWQWVLAHGHSYVGKNPRSVSCLERGQRGPVWFLQNEYEGDTPVTVSCQVPAGRYLFLEGPTFECSTVEPPPFQATRAGLRACAKKFVLAGSHVTLDGKPIQAAFPVTTPVFGFVMPAVANVLNVPGQTHGYAAVHGDAAMLRPLRRGAHTIVQIERFAGGASTVVTWQIVVR